MFNNLLSFLFPNPCIVCMKPVGRYRYVCDSCRENIDIIKPDCACKTCLSPLPSGAAVCAKCLKTKPSYKQLVACASYAGKLRESLHRYKFGGRSDLHASYAWLMCMQLSVFGCTDFDIVVPVPLSKERLYERGFNQAELLAKDIAKQFHMPCVTNALKKRKNTKRQSELSMEQRNRNVRDAFVLDRADAIYKKHVLLIDDIFTTGATVREASAVLSCAAETITVCTVAKTMMK